MTESSFKKLVLQTMNSMQLEVQLNQEEQVFEVKLSDLPWHTFLAWTLEKDHIKTVHLYCIIGYVTDSSAFLSLLLANNKSIMYSPFYFSLEESKGNFFIALETRQFLDVEVSDDQANNLIYQLIANHFFLELISWTFDQSNCPIKGINLFSNK